MIFLGSDCAFAREPFLALAAAKASQLTAVLCGYPGGLPPASGPGDLPMAAAAPAPASIAALARQADVPLTAVGGMSDPATVEQLRRLEPDLICCLCVPQRVPRSILELPRLGCVNVHPSLLPRNRGPMPLFWTFRQGDPTTGVTIHLMDAGLDTGPILAQESIPVMEGVGYAELEAYCSQLGGRMLVDTVRSLATCAAAPREQNEAEGDYHSWPSGDDFVAPLTWSARRAFNFIRGVGELGQTKIQVDGRSFAVTEAEGYDERTRLHQPYVEADDAVLIQFCPGVLRVQARSA